MKALIPAKYIMGAILLFAFTQSIRAETLSTKTIHLHHESATNIIPLIQPLLPTKGKITGNDNEVTITTSAKQMPQYEKLIADLDTPIQNLVITVSLDPGVIKKNSGSTNYYLTEDHLTEPNTQEVNVAENSWAVINTGRSVPTVNRTINKDGTVTESITYNPVKGGLRLKPLLHGADIKLTIQPFYEAENRDGTRSLAHGSETTASTRLGQWLALGTTSGLPTRNNQLPSANSREYEIFIRLNLVQGDGFSLSESQQR